MKHSRNWGTCSECASPIAPDRSCACDNKLFQVNKCDTCVNNIATCNSNPTFAEHTRFWDGTKKDRDRIVICDKYVLKETQ